MILSKKENTKISKILSYILRHKPGSVGLSLDINGWVNTNDLVQAIDSNNEFTFNLDILKEIVDTCDKKRYSFSSDMAMIRANQGHSLAVDLQLEETAPPKTLLHGTSTRFEESIDSFGILKGSRAHVHLSDNLDIATIVGNRHGGKCLIYVIDCEKMIEDGHKFYLSENKVWLTDDIPRSYLIKKLRPEV